MDWRIPAVIFSRHYRSKAYGYGPIRSFSSQRLAKACGYGSMRSFSSQRFAAWLTPHSSCEATTG